MKYRNIHSGAVAEVVAVESVPSTDGSIVVATLLFADGTTAKWDWPQLKAHWRLEAKEAAT